MEPSIFRGTLVGAAIAMGIGVLATVGLILGAGRYEAAGGLKLFASAGGLGAIVGYHLTVKRRKTLGFRGPEWSKIIGSGMSFAIAMIVIAGAFLVAMLVLFAYKALAGK
jgi:hypothetical protein